MSEQEKPKGYYRENRLDNLKTWKGAEGKLRTLEKRIRYWYKESKKFKGMDKKHMNTIKEKNDEIVALGGEPLKWRKMIKEEGLDEILKHRLED